MLEQIVYLTQRPTEVRNVVYSDKDLTSLSASVFYSSGKIFLPNGSVVDGNAISGYEGSARSSPTPIGQGNSGFVPASSYNLGPGIVRPLPDLSYLMERIRAPGSGDSESADHLNFEYRIPGLKKPLINLHIPLSEDD